MNIFLKFANLNNNIQGASVTFIVKIFNSLFMYITLALVARILTPEEFGAFTFFTSLIPFVMILAKFGVEFSIVSDLPKIEGDYEYRNTLSRLVIGVLVSVGLVMILLFITRGTLQSFINIKGYSSLVLIFLLVLPFFTFIIFFRAWHQSQYLFIRSVIPENVVRPFLFFLLIILMFLIDNGGVQFAAWSYVISFAITFIVSLSLGKEIFKKLDFSGVRWKKDEISKLGQFTSVQLLNQSVNFIPVMILGVYLTSVEIGIFRVAQQTTILITFLLTSVNMVFAPTISSLYGQGKLQEFKNFYTQTTKWLLIVGSFITVVVFVNGSFMMGIFGAEYKAWAFVLQIFAIAQLINASTGSSGHILLMTNRQSFMVVLTAIQAVLTIGLSLLLVNGIGLVGVTVAVSAGIVVLNFLQIFVVWKKFGFHPYSKQYFSLSIFIISIGIFSMFIKSIVSLSDFMFFVLSIISIIIVYIIVVPVIGLDNNEKQKMMKLLKSRVGE